MKMCRDDSSLPYGRAHWSTCHHVIFQAHLVAVRLSNDRLNHRRRDAEFRAYCSQISVLQADFTCMLDSVEIKDEFEIKTKCRRGFLLIPGILMC